MQLGVIQTFVCSVCGQDRSGVRRRCYPCTSRQTPESREKIRRTLTGVKHPPERVLANSRGHKGKRYGEAWAAARRGHPAHNRLPVGYVRTTKGRWQVKCPDGKFRYQARVMWEAAYGPIPKGMVIHHVNHDPFDDRLDNFQLLSNGDHTRHHADSERSRAAQKLGVASRLRNREARGYY